MRKKILVIWILFIIINFSLKDDMLVALPDIAHEDITEMSASIKRNFNESDTNGLKNAMGGDDQIKGRGFWGQAATFNKAVNKKEE